MLTNHKEIKQWLDSMEIKNYSIRPDGIVDVNGDVNLTTFKGKTFPVQFGFVSVCFDCSNTPITSLQGAPSSVGGGGFYCSNTPITSLQGAPSSVVGDFYCANTKITSLSGIHKIIKYVGGDFYGSGYHNTHILGLLLIKGITSIFMDGGPIDRIMNRHTVTGDIISAQDELIDAGFREQATL